MLIYKILRPTEWDQFESSGTFDGSPDDRRDGFVHCSSREQVATTAVRIFGEEQALVVLAIEGDVLGDAVRWEPASNGEEFPHVYRPIPRDAVVSVSHVTGAEGIEETLT